MERSSVEAVARALNGAGVRYLVVGGLAVVAHGHVRFTADLDLFIDLDAANLTRALNALAALAYGPRAPVALLDFADAGKRSSWVRDKGLTVFSLGSQVHRSTEIDLFVEPPFDFATGYTAALIEEVAPGVEVRFVEGLPEKGFRGHREPSVAQERRNVTPPTGPDQPWPNGWVGHAQAQARRLAALPFAEKLLWLEEAQRVADHLNRNRPKPR